jgi:hypothetical protein
VVWGLLALAATAILSLAVGLGGAAVIWIQERLGGGEFRWPGDLVSGTAAVGIVLSIPSATWAVSYASTLRAPQGRALLATALGVGALVAISMVDRTVGLVGGAGMAFAVALPFDPWHRLVLRIVPLVTAILVWAAVQVPQTALLVVVATAVGYPLAGILVWIGDAAWRAFLGSGRSD